MSEFVDQPHLPLYYLVPQTVFDIPLSADRKARSPGAALVPAAEAARARLLYIFNFPRFQYRQPQLQSHLYLSLSAHLISERAPPAALRLVCEIEKRQLHLAGDSNIINMPVRSRYSL